MARISVSVDIAAPIVRVWDRASDLETHAEWMADAESIEFLTDQRRGTGTKMRVVTRVGPLHTDDIMEVTDWVEERAIGVRHSGLVTGWGRFDLAAVAGATRFSWTEDLSFPWYLGGGITAWFARPVLAAIWRRNLSGLKRLLERG